MIPRVPQCSQLPALMKETTRSDSGGKVSGGNQAYAGRGDGLGYEWPVCPGWHPLSSRGSTEVRSEADDLMEVKRSCPKRPGERWPISSLRACRLYRDVYRWRYSRDCPHM